MNSIPNTGFLMIYLLYKEAGNLINVLYIKQTLAIYLKQTEDSFLYLTMHNMNLNTLHKTLLHL